MKIPTKLLWRVLLDVRLQPSDTIDRDYREICSRYRDEGMSFLTITLPRLDDALLKGLANGRLSRLDFMGFRPWRRGGSLPALLQGFFRRIFGDDGSLLLDPDVSAIFAIRQVSRLFKKVELPCSEPRIHAAYKRYQNNDETLDWGMHRHAIHASTFTSVCGYLWSDLESLSGELYCFPGTFGSGATAERRKRNERLSISEWPERSECSFPSDFHTGLRPTIDSFESLVMLPPEAERPVRVVQVPKTLKTPRTISVEPSYMMLMQQSIARPLMSYLESKSFDFRSIRFTDQSVNRELARRGSIDGSLATIDLSDASDLVSNDLVCDIFRKVAPTFLQLIQDCRTRTARLPDGTILNLRKFASMGSALCFPIESMVFFTIVMYALVRASGKSPSRRLLLKLAEDVAVYGDDIIVPSSMAPVVMETLVAFGLRVNHDKSFHTGLFRESCGGDYYKGVDVTPAYVRQWDNTGTLSKSSQLVAYAALSNILYMKGMWHACQSIRDHVSSRSRRRIPLSRHPIGCIHYASFLRSDSLGYDRKTHSYRVRGLSPRARVHADKPSNLTGYLFGFDGSRQHADSIRMWRIYLNQRNSRLGLGYSPCWDRESIRLYGLRPSGLYRRSNLPHVSGNSVPLSCGNLDGTKVHVQAFVWSTWSWDAPERGAVFANDYASYLPDSGFQGGNVPRLEHLARVVERSLDTSERPYSLCLKSTWTASPAGLQW